MSTWSPVWGDNGRHSQLVHLLMNYKEWVTWTMRRAGVFFTMCGACCLPRICYYVVFMWRCCVVSSNGCCFASAFHWFHVMNDNGAHSIGSRFLCCNQFTSRYSTSALLHSNALHSTLLDSILLLSILLYCTPFDSFRLLYWIIICSAVFPSTVASYSILS